MQYRISTAEISIKKWPGGRRRERPGDRAQTVTTTSHWRAAARQGQGERTVTGRERGGNIVEQDGNATGEGGRRGDREQAVGQAPYPRLVPRAAPHRLVDESVFNSAAARARFARSLAEVTGCLAAALAVPFIGSSPPLLLRFSGHYSSFPRIFPGEIAASIGWRRLRAFLFVTWW